MLRMEVRLNKKQKLIQILKKIGINEQPTFKLLFNKNTAQMVLIHYLEEIEAGYPSLLAYTANDPKSFLTDFMLQNPQAGLRKALQMLGLRLFLINNSIREFREVTKRHDKTNWYRLQAELRNYTYPQQENPFELLRKSIDDFKPLKMADFYN